VKSSITAGFRAAVMDRGRRRALVGAGAALGALVLPGAVHAQGDYPNRPVKLIVPFPAGALTDLLGRTVAERLRPVIGQPIVVENKPGAGTLLGAALTARSPADGYTLLVATSTTLAISPAMYEKPAAVASDFSGIAMIGNVSLLLVTRPGLSARSLPELVALIRRSPGKLNFASPGNGTMHHLVVEMIKAQEKLEATHVPYQGSVGAMTDLMSGRVDFMFLDAATAMPHVQAGTFRVIALAAPQRSAALPDVPTVAELYPAIDVYAWQAVVAPRRTPADIVQRLNADLNKLLGEEELRTALLNAGVNANPMSIAALDGVIERDAKRFAALLQATGIRA
jgi:tripartite-type tricarboxylate transporter receptor subunit TctC